MDWNFKTCGKWEIIASDTTKKKQEKKSRSRGISAGRRKGTNFHEKKTRRERTEYPHSCINPEVGLRGDVKKESKRDRQTLRQRGWRRGILGIGSR